tara:strand:+ start:177 stop:1484 length:1308 start_codon:yes stop_codon:yes gene_type:complete
MRLSQYFLPTLKETPQEAQVVSHRLMLRAGMISQSTSGIYSWLPLGSIVLRKIEAIVRNELNQSGAHEVVLPTIQSADLWKESGRYDAYGAEMLRFQDRHDRDMLYTPTAEELMTDIARRYLRSYRDLPQSLYQIQWKFRDEIRPRFGVMRGREFYMKDAYSFDVNEKGARESYFRMMRAYIKTFDRLGLTAVPVRADPGPIGGDLSHEFHIIASTGESLLYYDRKLEDIMAESGHTEVPVDAIMDLYAMEEEMHDPENCPVPASDLRQARGIEVGHIFYFGTKYSEALGANITDFDGKILPIHMGSYGIGISRLVAAIIEASHDEAGIIWPESVAPFQIALINLKVGDSACDETCQNIYDRLIESGVTVLYDDRQTGAGDKFATMDLIGLPWQVRVGPKGLKAGTVEIKCRRSGVVQEISLGSALTQLTATLAA